jgi:phosphoglycolate phosphatase
VFDLDGTLIDSRRDLADAANAVLEECRAPRLSDEAIGGMVGDGAAALVARAFAAAGTEAPADALERFLARYQTRLLVHTRAYPGVPEALAALGSRVPLGLLTNKPLDATRQILAGLDLARHFNRDAVVGGDGPYPRKPDPAGLRFLCGRADVAPAETLLVGDSRVDTRTAVAAGAAICVARYGFGAATLPPNELAAADWTVDAPADLVGVYESSTLP